jgi:hypothetical protein
MKSNKAYDELLQSFTSVCDGELNDTEREIITYMREKDIKSEDSGVAIVLYYRGLLEGFNRAHEQGAENARKAFESKEIDGGGK